MFDKLVESAKEAYFKAYAPYSNFRVGASALTENGEVVHGCNVENASYGQIGRASCRERVYAPV